MFYLMPVDFIIILKGILVLLFAKKETISYTQTKERSIQEKPLEKKLIFRKKKSA